MTSPSRVASYVSRGQQQLVLRASKKALQVRSKLNIPLSGSVCIAQVAQDLGVEVRYVDIPSMEGMYCRVPEPTILLSTHRPAGRQAFTIGHELGHHLFGHGQHIHELLDGRDTAHRFTPEERLADAFSACFLMPKSAVGQAFAKRGILPESCSPFDVYQVAWWFGVGYETLIQHMRLTLGLIAEEHSKALLRHNPKSIRAEILGSPLTEDLIPVDFHWNGRAVDTQIGDLVYLPTGVRIEGTCVEIIRDDLNEVIVQAKCPGIGRLVSDAHSWAAFIRVSRRAFVGRACYRFLEDEDDELSNIDN